jgi:hypothetical protein
MHDEGSSTHPSTRPKNAFEAPSALTGPVPFENALWLPDFFGEFEIFRIIVEGHLLPGTGCCKQRTRVRSSSHQRSAKAANKRPSVSSLQMQATMIGTQAVASLIRLFVPFQRAACDQYKMKPDWHMQAAMKGDRAAATQVYQNSFFRADSQL